MPLHTQTFDRIASFPTASRTVAILAVGLLSTQSAWATSVQEAPWRADAAAYRVSLFLGNLTPVPWDRVAAAWEEPYLGAEGGRTAFEILSETAGEDAADAIRAAVAAEDEAALFDAATRGLASAIIDRLDRAEAALPEGGAGPLVVEARELYRAFEDGVTAADPEAARALGLAWLDLASASGSRGVLGAGAVDSDAERFAPAKAEIAAYVAANYAPEEFTPREPLQPIPESVAATGAEVEMPVALPPASNLLDQDPLPLLVLNFEARGIDEADLPMVAYGDMLFDSPEIFGGPAAELGLACSTCHNRSDINRTFFIPGASHQPGAVDVDSAFFNPITNDQRDDSVDIPTLRGIRFTAPYGRDGRFTSLREFTRNVHMNEFASEQEMTPFMMDSMLAYLLEFDFLPNSKLDAQGRLTDLASEEARRGEKLFTKPFAQMGERSCATCHVPSAHFIDRLSHNIGSEGADYENSRGIAYDTPSLLGVNFTAPYFHDGSIETLGEVVDWFDANYELGLSETERSDLTAYVEAVGDADEPYEAFDAENTPFRLAWAELTTFATTLDTLLPRRDAYHAKVMIDTVAPDLVADSNGMSNNAARPKVFEMAGILRGVGDAIDAEEWDEAEGLWAEFQAKQEEYDADMY